MDYLLIVFLAACLFKRLVGLKLSYLQLFLMFFCIYFIGIALITQTWFIALPIVLFIVFWLSFKQDKRQLKNGLLFNLFLASVFFYLIMQWSHVPNNITTIVFLGSSQVLIATLLIGPFCLALFFYYNFFQVRKYERLSFANLLTLFLALGFTALYIFKHLIAKIDLPMVIDGLLVFGPLLTMYLAFTFSNFLTASILYSLNPPKYQPQKIIVLGAGLIDGQKVTPLLAARIKKGISFLTKENQLIMSGGQGSDEKISEAQAMANEAHALGVLDEQIILEDKSRTTYENMLFSKRLVGDEVAVFVTNNYHLFRASLLAKRAGLKADGAGAKTAFYFIPNAFIREFIAILMMHKRRHLIAFVIIILYTVASTIWRYFQILHR
ncbi:MAG: YdcF family protein [Streptococcaceae bacterium]|jgi:uncharacterized SAM-binding protein YcdF (DUF218 family)|nr:YdcF family protein [Streptococcaceae bacterium]